MKEQYLRSIKILHSKIHNLTEYPYNLTAIKNIKELELHPQVTFIIGENGSGKSTLLEAIAVAYGFNPEGGRKHFSFQSKETHSDLYKYIQLIKGIKQPKTNFFLRAESFYNAATYVDQINRSKAYGGISLHEQSHRESFLSLFTNRFSEQGFYILDEPEAALSPNSILILLSQLHQLTLKKCQFIIATHSPILIAYPNAWIYQVRA